MYVKFHNDRPNNNNNNNNNNKTFQQVETISLKHDMKHQYLKKKIYNFVRLSSLLK